MRKSCWHVLTSVQFIWSSYITCLHELVTVLISAYFPRYFCYFNEFNRIYYFAAILLFQRIPYFHIFGSTIPISMNPICSHSWQYNSYFNESHISTYITIPISMNPIFPHILQFLFQWIPYFHIYYNSYFN